MSRSASTLLAFVGALLLLIGAVSLYAESALFDAEGFAERAVDITEDEEARAEIARVVGAGLPVDPAASGPVVGDAVGSPGFRRILEVALVAAHRAAFERDRESGPIVLEGVDEPLRARAEAVAPELAGQLPTGLDVAVADLADGGRGLDIAREVERVNGVVWLTAPLGLAFILASVLLAYDRSRALRGAGVSLLAVGLLVIALNLFAGATVASAADTAGGEDVVDAAWDAIFGGLTLWGVVLAVAGAAALGLGLVSGRAGEARWRDRATR